MNREIKELDTGTYPSFASDVKSLPANIRLELQEALKNLIRNPQPKKLRFEKLQGNNKPPVYTIHITKNHSHKMSFELDGCVAVLRHVDTHKVIDRRP